MLRIIKIITGSATLKFSRVVLVVLALSTFNFQLSTFTSCTPATTPEPEKGLQPSKTEVSVAFDETTTSLTIRAKLDWELSIADKDKNWITADVTRGVSGTTTVVNFTLSENDGTGQRKGTVTITAEGESEPYRFTITQEAEIVLSGVNKWIYDELCDWYYWNDAVKAAAAPPNSLAYDEFLGNVIWSLGDVKDSSNGEKPPTIDGIWNSTGTARLLDDNGHPYIYSRIDRLSAATRADESTETTFGFDIKLIQLVDRNGRPTGQFLFLVNWVRPDSPAAEAGLKRGMWITKYNGSDITWAQYENFYYRLHNLQGGTRMDFTVEGEEGDKPFSLEAVPMKVSPIIHHEVLTSGGGKKVAYLVYNEFEEGEGGEFDDELREVFGDFKAKGAQELVLDLRYNPGGYVSSCRVLSSLAANVSSSDTFMKQLFNGDVYRTNPQVSKFLAEPNKLALRKIYVLGTGDTASASEMVVSSLRGVDIEVVLIGEKTNGKNVGSVLLESGDIGGYKYEMWPIAFKNLNAKDFCDYAGGFDPEFYVDELYDALNSPDGVLYEFGDPKERLLKAALTHIDGGTVATDTQRTRAAGADRARAEGLKDPRRGGMKYVPDRQRK